MRYLIVGTGGVGGSIAAFLALNGNTVICIARGQHKENMLSSGFKVHSGIKGEHVIPCSAYSEAEVTAYENNGEAKSPHLFVCETEEFTGKADRIFVTVKGYSIDSVAPCIVRAARPDSIVIPVLNVYGTGPRVARACPGVRVIDGCIYIFGYINAPGEVTQVENLFHIVFGARREDGVADDELRALQADLQAAGMQAELSDDINRDTFIKWGFISAMACTGAYFDEPIGSFQHPGPERDLFVALIRESVALGELWAFSSGATF